MDGIAKYREMEDDIKQWDEESIVLLKKEVQNKQAVSGRAYNSDADLKLIDSLYCKVNRKSSNIITVGLCI